MIFCDLPPLQSQLTFLGFVFLCFSFVVISQSCFVPFIFLYPITATKATRVICGGRNSHESPLSAHREELPREKSRGAGVLSHLLPALPLFTTFLFSSYFHAKRRRSFHFFCLLQGKGKHRGYKERLPEGERQIYMKYMPLPTPIKHLEMSAKI